MLIVLIILLVVLGAGGGYYGHSRWGYGGGAGIGLGTLKVMRKRETLWHKLRDQQSSGGLSNLRNPICAGQETRKRREPLI